MLLYLKIHNGNCRSVIVFRDSAFGCYKKKKKANVGFSARRFGLRLQILEVLPYDLE